MMRLLGVELQRLRWRRMTTVVFGLVLLAAAALSVLTTYESTKPLTPAEIAQGVQTAKEQNAQNTPQQIRDCEKSNAEAKKAGQQDSIGPCKDFTPDMYTRVPASHWEAESAVPETLAYLGLLGVLVVMASFVGAETSSGALGNHLTFETRRTRVYWAKILAAALGSAVFAVVLTLAVGGVTWLVASVHHAPTTHPAGLPSRVIWSTLRAALALTVFGAAMAALAGLLRHTAAVIGLAVGYGVVSQTLVNPFPQLAKWDLLRNLQAVVDGSSNYYPTVCSSGPGGYNCSSVTRTITLAHGAWELGVLCAVVLVLGWLVFRRRDVN